MIVFPNAKINIGLYITSKRDDGYHNIETVFFPIKKLCDALEVITSDNKTDSFSSSGLVIDCPPQKNLCLKALHLLRQQCDIPPLKIHLHKNIPFGAGLGGGSADAAFMIKLLNQQYNAGRSVSEMEKLVGDIGADCPVFIRNKPVLAKGTGNIFSPIDISLKGLWIQIVIPNIGVSTVNAYQMITPKKMENPLNQLIKSSVKEWQSIITNDFESPVFSKHREIENIKKLFINAGALYTAMSGSGSAVYGIFNSPPKIQWTLSYFIHTEQIN